MSLQVKVGNVLVGGGAPVSVQSMTTSATSDTQATAAQIARLAEAGCDIVRVSVRDEEDARAIRALKETSPLPIVADIHFSARLAVLAVENGADKIRINPGNIGGEEKVKRKKSSWWRTVSARIIFPCAWGQIRAVSSGNTCRGTVNRRRRWWRVRCIMYPFWSGSAYKIS